MTDWDIFGIKYLCNVFLNKDSQKDIEIYNKCMDMRHSASTSFKRAMDKKIFLNPPKK